VLAALEPHQAEIARQARKQGRKESSEAYAADALVMLATEGTAPGVEMPGSQEGTVTGRPARGPRAMIHVRVDHAALTRGHTEPGEACEIPGVGPIPVATARSLSADAILSAIVTDGVDVKAVAHLGRNIPAHLRTALKARDPGCVVPGCDVRDHLEIDHIQDFGKKGPTCLANLASLCHWHHYLKTYHGYRLWGGPGFWCWRGPNAGRPPDGRPPTDRNKVSDAKAPMPGEAKVAVGLPP
jgi:hypothetical protein